MSWTEGIDLARYALGALLAILLPPAIAYWYIVHPFVGCWRRVGMRATYWFLGIFYLLTIAGLFPLRRVLLGRDLGTNPAIAAAVPLIAPIHPPAAPLTGYDLLHARHPRLPRP